MKNMLSFWTGVAVLSLMVTSQSQAATEVSGSIASSQVWAASESPYEVTGSIYVEPGAVLSIEPGVEILMSHYTTFEVRGGLQAIGTSEASIVWRGSNDAPNWWQGIQVNDEASATLDHCLVQNAGYSNNPAVDKYGSGTLSLKNSTLRNNSFTGLFVRSAAASFEFSNNFFENNATAVRIGIGVSLNDSSTVFTGNNLDVQLDAGTISNDAILNVSPNYSIYMAGSVTVAPTGSLTILPDTVLKAARYSRIIVNGTLTANGTAEAPIYFTHWSDDTVGGDANRDGGSSSPESNWWQGLLIQEDGAAELNHCSVSYAGYSNTPGIYKTGAGSFIFNNSTSNHHTGIGLRLNNNSQALEIIGSTFSNNGGPGLDQRNSPASITDCHFTGNSGFGLVQNPDDIIDFSLNTFEGNTAGSAQVIAGTLTIDRKWSHGQGDPEFTIDLSGSLVVEAGKTLTIQPGVIVRVARYARIDLLGNLSAIGNETGPIQLIGSTPGGNWWQGLRVADGSNVSLVHALVQDAGYGTTPAIDKLGSGTLTLQYSTIQNNANDGVYLRSASAIFDDTNVQYKNNATGVRLGIGVTYDDPAPFFEGNQLDVFLNSGDIANDVAWAISPDYSIYMSGSITVEAGATLTIVPGTVIKTAQYAILTINGTLSSVGSSKSPIYFTHWSDDTAGGDANRNGSDSAPSANWWRGISVSDGGSAEIEYSHVRYCGYSNTPAVYKNGAGSFSFKNSVSAFHSNDGISLLNVSETSDLSGSSFTQNGSAGLRLRSAPITMTGATFSGNGSFGIVQNANDIVSYQDNTFTGNSAGSVQVLEGDILVNHHWSHGLGDTDFTMDLAGHVTVGSGAELVIDPDITVRVAQYAAFTVNGALTAIGEADSPIEFVGSSENPAWWRGIRINDTGSADFQFTHIAHCGYSNTPALELNGTGGSLNLTNSLIESNSADGLRVSGEYSAFQSANNIFRSNNLAVNLSAGASFEDTTSVFEGNGRNLQLGSGNITRDTVWDVSPTVSFIPAGNLTVPAGVTLTIGPGSTIKMPRYGRITVNGTLNAAGTESGPIHFTHLSDDSVGGDSENNGSDTAPGPNWWIGLVVSDGGSANLSHTSVRYTGYSNNPGLSFSGTGELNLNNCQFLHSSSHGVQLQGAAESNTQFNSCEFSQNGSAGLRWISGPVSANGCLFSSNGNYGAWMNAGLAFDFSKNQFSSNVAHSIAMEGGEISGQMLWTRGQGSSFTAEIRGGITIQPTGVWNLQAGIDCYVARYVAINVKGILKAAGQQSAPTRFLGNSPSAAWWQGISVSEGGSLDFKYTEQAHGGYSGSSGINMSGSGELDIAFSRVRNNSGNGLYINSHTGSRTIQNSLFTENGVGVRVSNQASMVGLDHCGIFDNGSGVLNSGPGIVDARSCWWGTSSGPKHQALNPSGTGNPVSDNVQFEPWLNDETEVHPWIDLSELVLTLALTESNQALIQWPDLYPDAQLQYSFDLVEWQNVETPPAIVDGQAQVVLDSTELASFFRIHP